jgi:hypothetical protein
MYRIRPFKLLKTNKSAAIAFEIASFILWVAIARLINRTFTQFLKDIKPIFSHKAFIFQDAQLKNLFLKGDKIVIFKEEICL